MPRVPEYTPNVSLRPAFRQNIDVRATPEHFGADIGRGMQRLAAGLDNMGDAFARVAELENATRAKEADNGFAGWLRERMYGDNGFMTTEGRNAVDGRKAFEDEVEQKRREFGAELPAGAARHYQSASQVRVQSALQSAIVHTAGQRKKWVADASDARLQTFANDAAVNASNPEAVNKNIAAGILELRGRAELHGWDAETLRVKEAGYVSAVHKQIAMGLAQSDPLAASKYMEANGDKLTATDKLELDRALKDPIRRAQNSQDAARILGTAPTQSEPSADPLQPEPQQQQQPQRRSEQQGAPEGGVQPDPARPASVAGLGPAVRPDARGNYNYLDVARSLVGMHEQRDAAAISAFIRRNAGIEIDPRSTAWCAAFVNAVLGANHQRGTGRLNARSFLSYGVATDDPRPGDVVVLSRGDPNGWQGHVGFFAGFDQNGNVRVVGGNQSNSVSEATFSRDQVLSYRRASAPGGDMPQPNATVAGLEHIERELAKVDPMRRDQVRTSIAAQLEFREKFLRVQREETQRNAERWMIANPQATPDDLPIQVQQALGVSGMATLHNWHKARVAFGEPRTDESVLYNLQTLYADDPQTFGQLDMFKFRDRLSDADWKKVNEWRQTARTDQRRARQEGAELTQAFTQARVQLEAVGVLKQPSKMSDNDRKRVAQFQTALSDQIEAFKRENKKNPTQADIQSIINRLLLPVVIKTPGVLWDSNRDGLAFEARTRPDDSTVTVNVKYEDIPIDLRRAIASDLERELGRKPSPEEVARRYGEFAMGR